MTPTGGVGDGLARKVDRGLDHGGKYEKAAGETAPTLSSLENQLVKLYSKPSTPERESKIKALEIQYKRAQRTLEAIMTLIAENNKIIMSGIRKLAQQ